MQSVLAARSCFSIGQSILTTERLVAELQDVGATSIALTDEMTVSGLVDFSQRAVKAGIKPIIGCRLRLVDDPTWRKAKGEKEKQPPEFYLTWYVLSEKGLQALYRLLTIAHSEERFYFNAKLGFDDLFDALKGVTSDDVAIASGDVYSALLHKDARDILKNCSDALSPSNVYLTLSPINTPLYDTLNMRAIEMGRDLGLPFLISRPIYYGREDGEDISHEIMGAIAGNVTIDKMWHKQLANRDYRPLTTDEFKAERDGAIKRLIKRGVDKMAVIAAFSDAIKATAALPDRVTYAWRKQPPSLPKMAPDEYEALVAECKKGWAERFKSSVFGHRPSAEEVKDVYLPRLKYELETLKRLSFAGYFLLVQDIVRFAKTSGILVGPGRGSIGGSLVAYLMGITDCDPIRFGLLFERFINPDRLDLPDADLDFMSERRHEIVEYLTKKYGADHVAGVANYMALGTASSIRDVSRVVTLPESAYRCSKYAPKEHGAIVKLDKSAELVPEIAAFRDENPDVWRICQQVEGVMRNLGQHAAGIVVAGCPLTERAFVDRRKGGEGTVCFDKRLVEDQGLIKMDILGLSTLDLVALAMQYIRERHSTKVNLNSIPLDDAKVLELFGKGKTTGIFQFEGGSARRMIKDMNRDDNPITFDDLVAANALNRPGPIEAGLVKKYIDNRNGSTVEYDHPMMKPALEETFGVMVYQEQLMRISRDLCGFSGSEADLIRKAVGKKDPVLMASQGEKFIDGATAGNIKVEMDDGSIHVFHRLKKFPCADGVMRTIECAITDGVDITNLTV